MLFGLGDQWYTCWLYVHHDQPVHRGLIDPGLVIQYIFYGAGHPGVAYIFIPTFSRVCPEISCVVRELSGFSQDGRGGDTFIDTESDLQVFKVYLFLFLYCTVPNLTDVS